MTTVAESEASAAARRQNVYVELLRTCDCEGSDRLTGAALWGFAEATLFFLVPDVLLSAIALRRGRLAGVACLVALLGALPGGALLYRWGEREPVAARRALDRLPAISTTTIDR